MSFGAESAAEGITRPILLMSYLFPSRLPRAISALEFPAISSRSRLSLLDSFRTEALGRIASFSSQGQPRQVDRWRAPHRAGAAPPIPATATTGRYPPACLPPRCANGDIEGCPMQALCSRFQGCLSTGLSFHQQRVHSPADRREHVQAKCQPGQTRPDDESKGQSPR